MNNTNIPQSFENRIQSVVREFHYPQTPDLSARINDRLARATPVYRSPIRKVWIAAAVLLALLIALMTVPSVRAKVLEFFQIGAVRIYPTAPAEIPALTVTPPAPTITPLSSALDLAGQTTLEQARKDLPFPVRLPAYPADLGQPDAVFVQRADHPVLVLVWMQRDHPSQVRMVLQVVPTGSYVLEKVQPRVISETVVNGQGAFWTEGPYMLFQKNGDMTVTRLVQGNTLIWTEGDLTYRLETSLTVEQAVKIAESLK